MALTASTDWEIEPGGSDTLNGGAFDPSQTAGMFTDGAATVANTAAPVFTSASYNFVAGDVGAWIYIALGTGWTPGWYKIASVGSNAATLNGTIGQGVLKTTLVPTTVIGCATVASPTGATWTIDYSQQSAAKFAYTDLTSTGAGLTCTSAGHPFQKQQVGNSIVVTGGTNANAGRYVIASISGVTATVVGPTNIFSGAGAGDGTGGLGGAVATLGQVAGLVINGNYFYVQTGPYSITNASTNVASGCPSFTTGIHCEGYGSVRGDLGTAPVFTASGINTATLYASTSGNASTVNLSFDGALLTSIQGINVSTGIGYMLTAKNCTNKGITGTGGAGVLIKCLVTGCTTVGAAFGNGRYFGCVAHDNTVTGFSTANSATNCVSYNNSGATSDGFIDATSGVPFTNCTACNNGRDGFRFSQAQTATINCIAEANAGNGFNFGGSSDNSAINCAAYNNGTNFTTGVRLNNWGPITGTSTFFANAAGGDFSLNNTAGGGALARAAGFPGTFPAGTSVGYLDIGAVQHQSTGGGSAHIIGG